MRPSPSRSSKFPAGRIGSPRAIVQLAVLAALIAVPVGLFHMVCPFGGIETLVRLVMQGRYLPKTGPANLVALGAVILSTIIAGPVFCGWICPLGAVQDLIRSLAARLGIKAAHVPDKVERVLSLFRFAVLGLIAWATAGSFNLVFMNADPYYALLRFWTGEVAPAALVVLGLVLAASLFVARPWCRWLCPLGGILSVLGRYSLIKMRRPAAACPSCGTCARACPVGIDPSKGEIVVDARCVRCGECVAACPPAARRGGAKPRTPQLAVAAALLAVFLAAPSIAGSAGSGSHTGQARAAVSARPAAAP
jgi:polyferredoxin